MKGTLVVVAAFAALNSGLAAQAPTFEVASIRVNKSGLRGDPPMARMQPGGRWTATNLTLRDLVRNSYRLLDFQMDVRFQDEDGRTPSWFNTERFDIAAKGTGDASPEDVRVMVRALLADRFKLVTHMETREMPIYDLVMARSDRRPGPNLKRTEVDCDRAPAPPPGLPDPKAPPPCGFLFRGPGLVRFRGVDMSALARSGLVPSLDRFVIDRTGLAGRFDIELVWAPAPGEPGVPPPPGGPLHDSTISSDGPSLFTAIQEQLGLKLEPGRGPVDVLVIDGAAGPTEN
jgi:uncharacterized protein (TIGR03435 family)